MVNSAYYHHQYQLLLNILFLGTITSSSRTKIVNSSKIAQRRKKNSKERVVFLDFSASRF